MRGEAFELVKAWAVVSLAVAFAMGGISQGFLNIIAIAAVTVGLGMVAHELSHKYVAQRLGTQATFLADNKMLILALAISFFGILFIAPGAVMIRGPLTARKHGMIASAGPFANLILAFAFFLASIIVPSIAFFSFGAYINAWIGLFNMIPFGPFDGLKIFRWSKPAFIVLAACLGLLVIL